MEGEMRLLKLVTATLLAALMLSAAPTAVAGSPKGVCQSGGFNSVVLADAMARYWSWYYGGATGPQEVGRLFLVPMPGQDDGQWISADPYIFEGAKSFEVRAGRTLVLPLAFFLGESYLDGTYDDPEDYPIDFKADTLLLMVDGRVIADSSRTKLDCVYIDLTYFEEPIVYPEPSSYESDAAIWMMGLGILLPPMSPGEHTIEMQVMTDLTQVQVPGYGYFLGYYNTWHVTVVKP
jgi:hypothetical protein